MGTFVKEYDWMWSQSGLNLSPVECRIYAYIYGLTESKTAKTKGYNGSTRQLSRTLGLSLGMTSIVLNNLQKEQLIILQNGVYMTVQLSNDSVQLVNSSVQLLNENVQPLNESVQSLNPRTPINKDKEKREENNIACDTIATPNPSTFSSFDKTIASNQSSSFNLLLAAFKSHNCNTNPSADILATARNLWEQLPDYKQSQLLQAINDGSWNKPRLDWIITDFKFREPVNYAGLQAPRGAILYQVPIAPGKKAVYTIEDVKEFHIPNAKFYMKVPL